MDVKRYSLTYTRSYPPLERPDGEWVRASDYILILKENEALREDNKSLRDYIASLMSTLPKLKADAIREALENTPNHRLHGEARLFYTQSSLLHYADKLEQGEK